MQISDKNLVFCKGSHSALSSDIELAKFSIV